MGHFFTKNFLPSFWSSMVLFAIYKVSDILALLLSELQLVNKVGHIPPSKRMLCKPVSQSVGLRLLIPFESSHFALFSNNIH